MIGIAEAALTAEDIEAATEGRVQPPRLNQWVQRGYFNYELAPGGRGKTRLYTWIHAVEAGMLAELASRSVPLPIGRTWNAEVLRRLGREENMTEVMFWIRPEAGMQFLSREVAAALVLNQEAEQWRSVCFLNPTEVAMRVQFHLEKSLEERGEAIVMSKLGNVDLRLPAPKAGTSKKQK